MFRLLRRSKANACFIAKRNFSIFDDTKYYQNIFEEAYQIDTIRERTVNIKVGKLDFLSSCELHFRKKG